MNDRELLEMAAKAAGYRFSWGGPDKDIPEVQHRGTWNPLAFGDHTIGLAKDLRMNIGCSDRGVVVEAPDGAGTFSELCDWKRAIVRAAAEIGRVMK